ncbi:MAG: glycosyltransferase family 4 protein [Actinomycetota bacterium]|nr:glycosyltransferase family 4 protein [Actinomycetota bacterium]
MRILIWHGYLLDGTGSNIFTQSIARELSSQGHDVTVLSQDADPARFDLGGARAVRPPMDGDLPVFVLDQYSDMTPRLLQDFASEEREHFVQQAAEVIRLQGPADFLITNHLLMGAPVGAASGLPFAVMVHGSELEFAMSGNPELIQWAVASLRQAHAVIAGSLHIVHRLREVVGPGDYEHNVHVVAPGVDTQRLHPQSPDEALTSLIAQCQLDPPNSNRSNYRLPDPGNADRLTAFLSDQQPTVVYVGKLSKEKGVDLLMRALLDVPARAVIAGFGPLREELEAECGSSVLFTGPLGHRHLAHLWPLATVSVVPSVLPEAFGLVAAEAAACGSPPLVAFHAGLAEVAMGLSENYPTAQAHLTRFRVGDVRDLATKMREIVALPSPIHDRVAQAARKTAVERWGLETTAERLVQIMSR